MNTNFPGIIYKRLWSARPSNRVVFGWLRAITLSILSLPLLVMSYCALSLPSLSHPPIAYASTHRQLDSSSYTDTVIVMDNVNQIRDHDPNGDRYAAAQLFVSLAPFGDRIGVVKI